jgi:outer membrane protein OmpA-like peptidoglycan-associated protein
MLRLAFTFILLLLMLFGGAVWLLDMTPDTLLPEQQAKSGSGSKTGGPQSDVGDLQDALKPGSAGGVPAFDIARIEPNGVSVFAGRAEPRSLVTITIDGKEIGTAQADDNGEWALATDAKIANPDGKLALFKAPPGAVPRVVGQEPQAKALAATDQPKQKTASAVASNMLKSLEGMVAAAREDQKPGTPIAAAPTLPPATTSGMTQRGAHLPTAAATAPAPGASATQSTTVPVPITFVFNEATLTGDGRRAAGLLLEYLQLKRFPKITLTGHADERGSDELNLALSRERLDTVANFLREGGYAGQLELIPKGKSEPYTGVVRGDFSQEDLWQLDRRVELVVSR